MKKLLLFAIILSTMQVGATRYLVQSGGVGAATWRAAGAGETVVDLSNLAQAFNTWYNATVISGDEVWIARGTYLLTAVNTIDQANHSVYGGFAGTETLLSERVKGSTPWDFINESILDGNNSVQVLSAANAYSNVVFDGLTITKSSATNAAAQYRDGVTLQNCKIISNTNINATGNGGGINFYNGGAVVNSYITGNLAPNGGGVYSNNASTSVTTIISGCLIENNRASTSGGGIRVQGAGMTEIKNCIFRGNKGLDGSTLKPGGAIYTNSINNSFTNCVISNNTGTNSIYFNGGIIINSTIANNVGQVYIAGATVAITITNAVIWGNKTDALGTINTGITSNTSNTNVVISNTAVYPSLAAEAYTQTDNIPLELGNDSQEGSKGPGFVLPTSFYGYPTTPEQTTEQGNANWKIKNSSGLLNTGKIVATLTTDISGNVRPQNNNYDIGAYERMPHYYKTAQTGNWNNNSTWNSSVDNSNWTSAYDQPSMYDQDIIIQDGHEVSITGNTSSTTLTIEPQGSLTINDTKTLTLSGNITLESSTASTATLKDINVGNGLTVKGTTSVQQYLSGGGRAWWYLASPLAAASSSIFGSDKVGKHVEDYENDGIPETTAPYFTSPFSTPENLTTGRGYILKRTTPADNATYTFTGGALNSGTISPTVTRTGTTAGARGFNLVGNPYPSYIDWDAVYADATHLRNAVWFRTYNGSQMVFHTYGDGDAVPEITSPTIAPMQAFWVKVDADGNTGTLTFKNSHRSHFTSGANPLKVKASDNRQRLRFAISNGTSQDETLVVGKSHAFDDRDSYDIEKMTNNNPEIPEIYSSVGNEELVINAMQSINEGTTFALGIRPGKAGSFTITTTQLENISGQVVLVDQLTGTETELTEGSSYSFSSDGTATNDRFSVEVRVPGALTSVKTSSIKTLSVYNLNNSILISGIKAGEKISIFNSLGQLLQSFTASGDRTELQHNFSQGVYLIKANQQGGKFTVR